MRRPRTLIAAALLVAGCAGPSTDAPPAELAIGAARAQADRAVARGASSAREVDVLHTLARYNPAPCDCSPWEVRLTGRWHRVELRPSDDESTLPAPSAEPFEIAVRLTRETVVSATGWRLPVVELSDDD